jgi:hypothetical protein
MNSFWTHIFVQDDDDSDTKWDDGDLKEYQIQAWESLNQSFNFAKNVITGTEPKETQVNKVGVCKENKMNIIYFYF